MPVPSQNPTDIARNERQAAVAVSGTVDWPVQAPTQAQLNDNAQIIEDLEVQIANLEDALKIAREQRREAGAAGYELLKRVDSATTMIYGETSAQKARYGVEPRKSASESGPDSLKKLMILSLEDGPEPGSIFADTSTESGAVYELEISVNSNFNPVLQVLTETASEGTFTGLTMGTQYWIRARAVRGGEKGPWSDPATRVANV